MSISKLPVLDLFGEPDISFALEAESKIKEKKENTRPVKNFRNTDKTSATTTTVTKAKKTSANILDKNIQQAFLPGLSRRGRPRSKNPISAVERTAEHRRKRLAEGSKRVEMILAPEVARQLEALAEQYNEPRSEVIATLVTKAYLKVFKAKPTKSSISQPDQV
ncbi:MAG: hypothetical protein Q7J51_04940 [Sheuella sp.]|nr:hypothetical protein [Sheuella sp.]